MTVTVDSEVVTVLTSNQTAVITLEPVTQTLVLSPVESTIVTTAPEPVIQVETNSPSIIGKERSVDILTISVGGGSGGGTSLEETFIAGQSLSALRIVKSDSNGEAVYASNLVSDDAKAILGLTLNAAGSGGSVTVQLGGQVSDDNWTWTPGSRIFLSTSGQITQAVPSSGFIISVGHAITATEILLRFREPIFLT